MGTRGLLGHIIRSKNTRKGAYNHFDSYPAGLGRHIAVFLGSLDNAQINKMVEMVSKIEWIDLRQGLPSKELQDRYTAFGFADTGVGSQTTNDWYCLLRNVQGAAALPHILDGTLTHLVDETSFEDDGLFCEWSYFIDWEQQVVRVRGGDHEGSVGFAELSERWMLKFENGCREDDTERRKSIGERPSWTTLCDAWLG